MTGQGSGSSTGSSQGADASQLGHEGLRWEEWDSSLVIHASFSQMSVSSGKVLCQGQWRCAEVYSLVGRPGSEQRELG